MLIHDLFDAKSLCEGETVDVVGTSAIINPWPTEVARMLAKAPVLRALSEPGKFVIWPAEEALHQPVQIALGLTDRARRYQIFSSTSRTAKDTNMVGRFHIYVMDASHKVLPIKFFPDLMAKAFGVRR